MELRDPSIGENRKEDRLLPESVVFDEEKDTLLLNVDEKEVDLSDAQVFANRNDLDMKDKFHITVLGFTNGEKIKELLEILPETEKREKLAEIKSLMENTDWSFNFRPEQYHISKEYKWPDPQNKNAELKERRESCIQMVDLPAMKDFYEALSDIVGVSLEIPPAHITLCTGGDDREKAKIGIGIKSQDEFLKLNPELIGS